MNSRGDALGLPSEYILQIDGNVKAKYQLFADALKAGLQLEQLYPHSDIKVPRCKRAIDFRLDANMRIGLSCPQGVVLACCGLWHLHSFDRFQGKASRPRCPGAQRHQGRRVSFCL